MPRVKEDRSPISTTLRSDLLKLLDKYSKETSIPKTKLLDKAVEDYLYKAKSNQ